MISLDGQTDSSDDDIILEEHNVEVDEVRKSNEGDTGRDGEGLMRSSRKRSLKGVAQNIVGHQEAETLPLLV